MGTLMLKDLIVYGVLVIFVLYVTHSNHMWGTRKGVTKTKVEARKDKSTIQKRNLMLKVLKKLAWLGAEFGNPPGELKLQDYKFKLNRMRKEVPYVERVLQPIELAGLLKLIKFLACFIAIVGLVGTRIPIFLVFLAGLGAGPVFNMYADSKISMEDAEIESDFPNLYLLLYPRLSKGAMIRIAPTLDDYTKSLDAAYGDNSHKAIKMFVGDLRNNIEVYGDDSLAIHHMRENYKSAMLVNFFNLAMQSLRGVNNKDKLLSFKMELSQQQLEAMKKVAQIRREKAQKAVYAIFIILAQFVLLSWWAKLGFAMM